MNTLASKLSLVTLIAEVLANLFLADVLDALTISLTCARSWYLENCWSNLRPRINYMCLLPDIIYICFGKMVEELSP